MSKLDRNLLQPNLVREVWHLDAMFNKWATSLHSSHTTNQHGNTHTIGVIKQVLDAKAAEKKRHYDGQTPGIFHPFIFSLGGTLSTATQPIMDYWADKLGPTAFKSLQINLGINLLRARARCFVL
jgi:hypothetical protein